MKTIKTVFTGIAFAVGVIVVSALLLALPVYFLWNALMPEIFGLITLSFWQALGVSLLAACLFGRGPKSSS